MNAPISFPRGRGTCASLGFVVSVVHAGLCLSIVPGIAVATDLEITVSAGKYDRVNVPASVVVDLPNAIAEAVDATHHVFLHHDKGAIHGQFARPGVSSSPKDDKVAASRELHFVIEKLKAGETLKLTAEGVGGPVKPLGRGFEWHDTPGKFSELRFGARPVLRYMYEAVDDSSKERRDMTFKVYHHVFDPKGERLVTKGPPGGLFPHHRGLFYGFNKITYGNRQQADVWHCRNNESQSHEKFLVSEADFVLGRHRLAVDWHGRDKKVFAHEQRELTVYNTSEGLPSNGMLIEFASHLTSTVGKVMLDGDPQHAGFHFRASQEVPDKTAKQTYYLRPDGKDKPGSFRNWDGKKNTTHENLPWNALSIVLGDKRYTVAYLDHPKNPKPARYSERDYGRFGSYFPYQLDTDKPLAVKYRVWLQEGEMTVDEVQALSRDFVEPATATVSVK